MAFEFPKHQDEIPQTPNQTRLKQIELLIGSTTNPQEKERLEMARADVQSKMYKEELILYNTMKNKTITPEEYEARQRLEHKRMMENKDKTSF